MEASSTNKLSFSFIRVQNWSEISITQKLCDTLNESVDEFCLKTFSDFYKHVNVGLRMYKNMAIYILFVDRHVTPTPLSTLADL